MKHLATWATVVMAVAATASAAEPSGQFEFFEKKIRPVLAAHCYRCHNSTDKKKGGLALDYKDALRTGGDSGAAVVPGKPDESVLIWALRHQDGYEMPANAPKLSDAVIKDFEQWVKQGAADPRLKKPSKQEVGSELPWEQIRAQRLQWWSFQPLREHAVPKVDDPQWNQQPIDRFVYDRLVHEGLKPQPVAPPAVLVRRLYLILTGLPPAPDVVQAFVANPSPEAYAALVDRLLASHEFGERWARHWMDWYRYAETHGSEGDPPIPHAQQYRDYLVRALNADVPYDQLLREHLAGDLLEHPRINRELGINESAIGPAHLRMVPHGFGVTDAYGEQITFTDNQIDVISKAMLGLTVACARCHNHKFDPVSQKDFYRLYGIMISCRPSTVLIDAPEKLATNKAELTQLKQQIRQALAEHWLAETETLAQRLNASPVFGDPPAGQKLSPEMQAARRDVREWSHPLGLWQALHSAKPETFAGIVQQHRQQLAQTREFNAAAIANAEFYVDLRDPANAKRWFATGNSTASNVSPAGSFALESAGDETIAGIYPRGIYSHLLSEKHAAVFSTGDYRVRGNRTLVRAAGRESQLRAPVRNYPLTHGLHPATNVNNPRLAWLPTQQKWQYWQGEKVHYELRTAAEIIPRPGKADRSWFGVAEIFAGDQPPRDEGASLVALVADRAMITDRDSLASAYRDTLRHAINAWKQGEMSDREAEFLDTFVRLELLTNRVDRLPDALQRQIARYRELESQVPVPQRAPGVVDTEAIDQPLLARGDYKHEGDPVRRQFLEIFANTPYSNQHSGRRELAEDMVSPANTLKTRVLINRLWAYVFGQGIVASTDNFGRLGKEPTHPELLDYLSLRFEREGWSIKTTLRQMVTSRTFRSVSQAPAAVLQQDPGNLFLSHFTPRRLDAEGIYDSINQLGGQSQRAVNLPVIRNQLDPFLSTFNAPVPTSTVSFRNDTNVPAQSLTLMNGDLVERAARAWSQRIERDSTLATPSDKIAAMVLQAYARSPTERELKLLLAYLTGQAETPAEPDLAGELHRVQQQLAEAVHARDAWLVPVRQKLQREVDRRNAAKSENDQKPVDLAPIARWDFEEDARDAVGRLHGELQGDAKIEHGTLVLRGGCMLTPPIGQALQAKTLEVLVQLDDLKQRGGGAMSVQTPGGDEFDAIVFAEMTPETWLAGSDFFRRTLPLKGPAEREAASRPVRIIMVYDADGTIRCYRDGKLYAEPYRKAGPRSFERGKAQVLIGLRHGRGPTRGRMLTGRIYEARLYDRALSAEEVAAASSGTLKQTVTRKLLLAALSAEQKQRLAEQDGRIAALEQSAVELNRKLNDRRSRPKTPGGGYYGIAHALLNSKEFIYVY